MPVAFVAYFIYAAGFCLEVRSVDVCIATAASSLQEGTAESLLDTVLQAV